MSMDLEEFHDVFFEECFENLEIMESGLIGLDLGAADVEEINTIFRAAHSIKGGSATFDFSEIAAFTHVMETLLDEMRDGRRQVTRPAVDLLLESTDCLSEMINATKVGDEVDQTRVSAIQNRLETMLSGEEADTPVSEAAVSGPSGDTQGAGWRILFRPHVHMLQTGNEPCRMLRELAELGDLSVKADLSKLPGLSELDPEECYLGWELTVRGAATEQQIMEIFAWVDGDCDLEVIALTNENPDTASEDAERDIPEKAQPSAGSEQSDATSENVLPQNSDPTAQSVEVESEQQPAAEPAKKAEKQTGKPPSKGTKQESGSIRVGIDKVDELINLVGELVITQSMLSCFASDFDMSQVDKLRDGLNQLARNTRELQETSMQIRMLPISASFNRFPRLVRDLSNKLGKKVELQFSGENTELDKTVLEKIGDPLVHLVRNSLDHGLETPDVRMAAGKPATGILRLNAYHQGGNIIIEVIDDGAGLNKERILHKAIERGVINEDDDLSDDQINNLIFQPGFSTAEQVSDVSGRGVGMDVVRRNINDLGGTVHIQSESGKGSTLTIRLPLTLAILDGQLVRVGRETYIVSLVSIVESLQVKPGQVSAIAGKAELYRLRDEYIPVIRLHEAFGVQSDSTELTEGLLVVVEADGQRVGVFVDDLLGQQQVVIKSLETNFQQVQGLSGATILGDGTVALIIDVPGLIQRHCRNGAIGTTAAAA